LRFGAPPREFALKNLYLDRVLLACCLALPFGQGAVAAPRQVEPFDARTWKSLQASLKEPTVVVFSATWCPNCPAVIEDLVQDVRQRKRKASVLAVVMDVAPGESDAALLRHAHYRVTDRLFAFSGQAPALRYGVDPAWRGATPYVVFLSPGAPARVVVGPPTEEDLEAWLRLPKPVLLNSR
jgi:thiol-disulfide isomerase/thioredoxin